jgi:hypothetical protein
MSYQSSPERILPPIMTIKQSSPISHSANNVSLPPVSCLAPPIPIPPLMSPITPPPDFTKNHNLHIQSSQSYINSERTSPRTSASGHYHFHSDAPPSQQQYVDQQRSQSFSPTRVPASTPQQLSHIPPPPSHHPSMVVRPMHHPYHPIYHQARPVVDPASELLAEKRRRNAGASARFRDRRKQREREMQEKCQFLERRVQELENMDSAKRIVELEKKLEEFTNEKDQKLQDQDKEVPILCNRCHHVIK